MKKYNNFPLIVMSLAVFLLFSCAGASLLAAETSSPLEMRLRESLATLPYYSVFDTLKARVEGTTAVLSGEVTRPELKASAEAAAKRVSDIQEVRNEIEVLPFSPNDDRIRLDAYRAIYYHPDFTRYAIQAYPPIHIIVKNGDIRLEGSVLTEADRNLAGIRAKSVPGAFSVKNTLEVVKD